MAMELNGVAGRSQAETQGAGRAANRVRLRPAEDRNRSSEAETQATAQRTRATADCCDVYDPSRAEDQAALRRRLLEVAGLSELFKVLGDETRTRILYLLSLQEMCVCDIADVLEMSLPAVSHHLRLLKLMRIVKYRREGKNVYYSLDDDHVLGLIRLAKEHYDESK